MDLDNFLYNDPNEIDINEYNDFKGEFYEGDEFEETFGQNDEETDTKMISEDFVYLDDICTKFELQVIFIYKK